MEKNNLTRFISGIIIIVIGLVFLTNNTGLTDFSDIINNWWPLALIFSGVVVFINNSKNALLSLFLIALGVLYQLKLLDIIDFEPWQVIWPLIIVFIGASVIFRGSPDGRNVSKSERDDMSAIMGGATSRNASPAFKGSKVSAIMGGAQLDLRKATITDGATINVFSFWGGVDIIVPENVIVRNQMNNILGGSEDRTAQRITKSSPTLIVTGDVIMAGVSIRNTPGSD